MKWFAYFMVPGSLFVSSLLYAEEPAQLEWLLDVDVSYQQQTIGKSNTELSSLTLAPSLEWENLYLSLTIPWYEKSGEFYINGVRSQFITRCDRLTALKPARQTALIESGKITQKLLDKCVMVLDTLGQLNATHSGIGDVAGFARYHFLSETDNGWSTNLGVGYKSNSGDSDIGIGSGTQDLLLEWGVNFSRENFIFSLNAGYDFMSNDNSIQDVYQTKNFAYTSADISQGITDWLRLGASFNAQQAYVEHGVDTKIVSEYVNLAFFDQLNIHVYISQYNGDSLLPDNEVGVNLSYGF